MIHILLLWFTKHIILWLPLYIHEMFTFLIHTQGESAKKRIGRDAKWRQQIVEKLGQRHGTHTTEKSKVR